MEARRPTRIAVAMHGAMAGLMGPDGMSVDGMGPMAAPAAED